MSTTPHQFPVTPPVTTPHPPPCAAPSAAPAWWRGGFEAAAASARGSYHPENEDSTLLKAPPPALVAVADGVGGGAQGKLASLTLIECIRELTPALLAREEPLRQWLHDADTAVAQEIAAHTDKPGASTFVAAAPLYGGRRWRLTWAGDCRAYRITANNHVGQLTLDDTYANHGEPPPPGASPDDPARMVGSGAVDSPNQAGTALRGGEILLLCSDGVHKYVTEQEILALMRAPETLQARCQKLVAQAHANGGTDDATAVAIERRRWFGLGEFVWWLIVLALLAGVLLFAAIYQPEPIPAPPGVERPAVAQPASPPVQELVPKDFSSPDARPRKAADQDNAIDNLKRKGLTP